MLMSLLIVLSVVEGAAFVPQLLSSSISVDADIVVEDKFVLHDGLPMNAGETCGNKGSESGDGDAETATAAAAAGSGADADNDDEDGVEEEEEGEEEEDDAVGSEMSPPSREIRAGEP